MRIAIASDHAGYNLKQKLIRHLKEKHLEIKDFGSFSEDAVDYPEYAHPLAEAIANGEYEMGISLCGSGNGISMTANKHPEIRSAICWEIEIAELARGHNDANICALPARFLSDELAFKIVDKFLNTSFDGGRHLKRINKIPIK